MQVELPATIGMATRGALPSYGRPFSSIGRPNSTNTSKRTPYPSRKGSHGASRASASRINQKQSTSTARTPSEEEQTRSSSSSNSSLQQPTASSGSTTTPGGHYYPKARHNSNGSTSTKSHNYQQQCTRKGHESLPPRLRNSTEHNSKKQHSSGKKNASCSRSSQPKASKDSSSAQRSSTSDSPNPAPSAPPPIIAVAPIQTQNDMAEGGEKQPLNDEATTVNMCITPSSKCHQIMSSSTDSGHFDDLSSSCESDSPSLPTSDHQQQGKVELVSMVISSGVESDHPASDVCEDDDVFVDALSNIPSENSSAYVTPYSTRSQSPVPPESSDNVPSFASLSKQDPSSSLDSQSSIEKVRDSLQKLLDLRLPVSSSSSSTVELDDSASPSEVVDRCLESCDGQVTILAGSKGEGSSKSTPCSIIFTHPSLVFDIDEDQDSQSSNHSPAEFRTRSRLRCLSKDISNMFIGEMELEVSSDGDDDSAVDFAIKSHSPSLLREEDEDSGCATSIGSPDKTTSSLDFKRPGILHMPEGLLRDLQMKDDRDEERTEPVAREDSSGQAENCSLELSDCCGPSLQGEEKSRLQLEERKKEDGPEREEDEWPDLFAEENQVSQPTSGGISSNNNASTSMFNYPGAPLSMQPVAHQNMNGFIPPPPFPPVPPSSTTSSSNNKSDPSLLIMASIKSHVHQQQQAVYQMFSNGGYPMGPPPPHMFPPPTGFMGFYPPPPFPMGPGFPPLPPHPIGGPSNDFLPPPPLVTPIHPQPRPPSSQSPAESSSEDTQGSCLSESSLQSTSASSSPPLSPALCEKHQLCSTWVMWYDKITGAGRGQMSDYKSTLQNLSTIDSIEGFWSTYNNILPPSGVDKCANYHFFKQGILPLWEDKANKQGGKWVLTIKDDPKSLDQTWMEVLLMLIGGGMEQFDNVNGVVVSRRKKGDRIALWTKKRSEKASLKVCVELVRTLCVAFEVDGEEAKRFVHELADNHRGISLAYLYHSDSLKSGNSYSNEQHIKLKDHVDTILQDL